MSAVGAGTGPSCSEPVGTPWEWSQALKAEFAKDADWQEREAKRSRERAFWKEQNEAKAREIEAQPEVADTGDGGAFDGLI